MDETVTKAEKPHESTDFSGYSPEEISPLEIRKRLSHTWFAFFAQHGSLTSIQQAAIPPILEGKNALITAATAAGKTEAAVVPLVQRYFFPSPDSAKRHSSLQTPQQTGLQILYICPTRALTKDLYERLKRPLAALDVSFAIKTGDTAAVSLKAPPSLLITTPESTDSLLTRGPRLFINLAAIVLDEIHLFDHTERGDHLRCLLRRIEHIRAYHQQQTKQKIRPLQRIALSATVPDPTGVAQRYLSDQAGENAPIESPSYEIISVPGHREIDADVVQIAGLADVVRQITQRAGERAYASAPVRKSLFFCNTRNEVEESAAYLRRHLQFEARVFVHYSNLDARLRAEVEADFAAASVAICVCTSTLELGIDIGSIDDVILLGAPPTLTSFLQRIGRGGRRTQITRVLCLARSTLEEAHFWALLLMAQGSAQENASDMAISDAKINSHHPAYHFRLSVLVQQIFSILKQSPTGAIRLADLARVIPDSKSDNDDKVLRTIFGNLTREKYLLPARLGEWRPGPKLDELVDEHEIYSNIGSDSSVALTLIDAFSGKPIAQTGRVRVEGDILLMGGRAMEVVWRDKYRLGVRPSTVPFKPFRPDDGSGIEEEERVRVASTPFAVPLDISQGVATTMGVRPNQLVLLREEHGAWLFHFWGAIYGALLASILQEQLYGGRSWDDLEEGGHLIQTHNDHCLRLSEPLTNLPPWSPKIAGQQLRHLVPRIAPFLSLGRFHDLLPPALGHRLVVDLSDLARMKRFYNEATVVVAGVALRERLGVLL